MAAGKVERQLIDAHAAHSAGRLQEAEDGYRKLLKRARRDPRLRYFLGTLLLQTKRPEEAAKHLQTAAHLAPDNADVWYNLGIAQGQCGELYDARDSYRRAVELQPDFLDAVNNLAGVLQQLGRAQDAAVQFRHAAELAPGQVEIVANLALALEMSDDLDGARDAAGKALAIAPDHAACRLLIAQIDLRQGGDPRAILQAFIMDKPADQYAQEAWLTLAKAREREGDYDGAFEAMVEGNRIAARYFAAAGCDGERFRAHVRRSREVFAPENFAAANVTAAAQPVFFVGFPRSGTTLLEQILDTHPDIYTTAERTPLDAVRGLVERTHGAYPDGVARASAGDLQQWRRSFWRTAERDFGAPFDGTTLVDKMPFNIVELGAINRLFPAAPVIVARRNAGDVCLSCFAQSFNRNDAMANFTDLQTTVDVYREVMSLYRYFKDHIGNPLFEYRYEDLVQDPVAVSQALFEFIGMSWRDDLLDQRGRDRARHVATPSRDAVAGAITDRAVGKIQRYKQHVAPFFDLLDDEND